MNRRFLGPWDREDKKKKVRIDQDLKLVLKSETKSNLYPHSTPPPLLLVSLSFYCWAGCHMVWSISFTSLGQLSWLCALQALAHPKPTGLCAPALLRSGQNMGVLSACSKYRYKAQRAAMGKTNTIQARPNALMLLLVIPANIFFWTAFLLFLFSLFPAMLFWI